MTSTEIKLPETETFSSIALSWWHSLEHNKGNKAELKRVSKPLEAVFLKSYPDLLRFLNKEGDKITDKRKERTAIFAALAAHVKKNEIERGNAEMMAKSSEGTKAPVSGLRFRQLLAAEEPDDLFLRYLRVIKLLDNRINLKQLFNDIYWWNDDTRKKYAYDYYHNAPQED